MKTQNQTTKRQSKDKIKGGQSRFRRSLSWLAQTDIAGLGFAYIVLFVFLSVATQYFFSKDNISNLLRQMSVLGIVAAGQTMVIIRAQIDLSNSAVVALSSIIAAFVAAAGFPTIIVILSGLCVGAVFGVVNGIIVAKGGVSALIVTLGTLTIGGGAALVLTGGAPQAINTGVLETLGQNGFLNIPYQFMVMVVVLILTALLLRYSVFGRSIYAAGDNEMAAWLNGIKVDNNTIGVFVASGVLSSVGGLLLAGQFATADPTIGGDLNLQSIAATVIGGTSLFGGIGGITGTAVGAALMATLSNGLIQLNVQSAWQEVVTGAVIVLAVLWDGMRTRMRKKG